MRRRKKTFRRSRRADNEVEETVSYNCRFEKDGLSYELLGFDLTMEPEQLAEMAAELATMGE